MIHAKNRTNMKKSLAFALTLSLFGAGCTFGATSNVQTETSSEAMMIEGSATATLGNDMIETPPVETNTEVTPKVNVDATVNVTAKTYAISIQNFAFSSKTITVKKGDKITFTNKDSVVHTATADNGAFDSGFLSTNESATIDTSKLAPGTYNYHCIPHPNMTGTIVVQ
jgi:plastocyanin